MSQASIQRYFNSRKRPATDDLHNISKKVFLSDAIGDSFTASATAKRLTTRQVKHKLDFGLGDSPKTPKKDDSDDRGDVLPSTNNGTSGPTATSTKVVTFIQAGPLSPKKRLRSTKDKPMPKTILKPEVQRIGSGNDLNVPPGAPKKKTGLSLDEIKEKISNSTRLPDLKKSLLQLNELERKRQELRKLNSLPLSAVASSSSPAKQLKSFATIDLEIESPCKDFKTPEKLLTPTPTKQQQQLDQLMSPRQSAIKPRKLLFSPVKSSTANQQDINISEPAYEKYKHLAAPQFNLELPFKYRCLIELFKCCDTVCAIFFNRKERITFKKLRPAVQRMCHKNFTEHQLAQIRHVLPEAYEFHQHKMRNFGSVSKQDYYQLVITPILSNNVEGATSEPDESMNSQRLMDRLGKFQSKLFDLAVHEHDQFLRRLKPPMTVARDKLTRWHPDWDIQSCPEVPCSDLPQPPNVEKFCSAQAVLSTARNLFNCATPMERAMARLEEKKLERQPSVEQKTQQDAAQLEPVTTAAATTGTITAADNIPAAAPVTTNAMASMLKGVPASLLEKIRAKQAAKALSIMTRRPSQEQEAIVYARLPELARHVRNVFVTEKKSCLTEELLLIKIMNSFRVSLTVQTLSEHLQLLAKSTDGWMTYHDIRKVRYVKLSRHTNVAQMMDNLRKLADEKCA